MSNGLMRKIFKTLFPVICMTVFLLSGAVTFAQDPFIEAANKTVAEFRIKAEELALWCEENDLHEQAAFTRSQLLPSAEDKIYVPTFPKDVISEDVPEDASELVKKWNADWWKIKKDYAGKLRSMLGRAVRQKRGVLAMQMAVAALHADPNNEDLRNILGLKKFKNQWRTGWEIKKLKQGFVEHDRFGWILAKYVSRYKNGERYYKKKWISAEEEGRVRSNINLGWRIESEHYTIITNHSLEEGVRLSRDLEDFYRTWKQVFVRFYASEDEFGAMFQGRPSSREPHLKIVYYKDQQSYIDCNIKDIPEIARTGGYFDLDKQCCFFFKSDDPDIHRTVYHEAAHQLFTCTCPAPGRSEGDWNFWITEAVAVYMESFHRENGYCVLGGYDQNRLKMARYRLFVTKFYVPFEILVQMNIAQFQAFPHLGIGLPLDWDLSMLYSQVGGMGHFFMHASGGKYREVFVDYLYGYYSGMNTPQTLFELIHKTPDQLNQEYVVFLKNASFDSNQRTDFQE